jgi:transposase
LKSLKGLKREDSYVAYVFRRVQNGRYIKFGLNRLRGQRVNLEHTDTQTHTHTFAFIYKINYV